ncbi:MAG: large conductance mechanosensitive channel protein MscL [Ruminococcus sp.]|nr:large conductance mechanosensitive channel protein MscL [Ruminococcus sp.]MDE7225479.1 large conductance mechanosensitive channel protein MscL [Ruminococcus sp.]
MHKLLEEFKAFVMRGNIVDMAIGVIIGGAFSGLVTSLLDNIISPILGFFSFGGINGLSLTLWHAELRFGAFFMDVVNFLVMALVVFVIMKFVNAVMDKFRKHEESAPVELSKEEALLTEIRDLLKSQNVVQADAESKQNKE